MRKPNELVMRAGRLLRLRGRGGLRPDRREPGHRGHRAPGEVERVPRPRVLARQGSPDVGHWATWPERSGRCGSKNWRYSRDHPYQPRHQPGGAGRPLQRTDAAAEAREAAAFWQERGLEYTRYEWTGRARGLGADGPARLGPLPLPELVTSRQVTLAIEEGWSDTRYEWTGRNGK